ncbi:hypothetical protein OIV83_006520 [Microbotryomycetes sp. JL201]|nr:hypothetical protein OIV83_006520 [Microbotryomycetes sp. JL201]
MQKTARDQLQSPMDAAQLSSKIPAVGSVGGSKTEESSAKPFRTRVATQSARETTGAPSAHQRITVQSDTENVDSSQLSGLSHQLVQLDQSLGKVVTSLRPSEFDTTFWNWDSQQVKIDTEPAAAGLKSFTHRKKKPEVLSNPRSTRAPTTEGPHPRAPSAGELNPESAELLCQILKAVVM